MADLPRALDELKQFGNDSLTKRISTLEHLFANCDTLGIKQLLDKESVTESLLQSALLVKQVASQIDVVVHAVGILVSLPYILEKGEVIQSLSLGAGNTGKSYDLETNFRVAEFKFINWRGGSESIRQNQLFKDLFGLVINKTNKTKYIYLTGAEIPLKFLNTSDRSLKSVLSKNDSVKELFYATYTNRYITVSQYYKDVRDIVKIVDLDIILNGGNI